MLVSEGKRGKMKGKQEKKQGGSREVGRHVGGQEWGGRGREGAINPPAQPGAAKRLAPGRCERAPSGRQASVGAVQAAQGVKKS